MPVPELDEATLHELDFIDRMRNPDACPCGMDALRLTSLDDYAALLESGEVDAYGHLRCSGWTRKGRRCRHRCSWREATGRPSFNGCCLHRGVYLPPGFGVGEWFCEHHGGRA